jgi:hypothetical protein
MRRERSREGEEDREMVKRGVKREGEEDGERRREGEG